MSEEQWKDPAFVTGAVLAQLEDLGEDERRSVLRDALEILKPTPSATSTVDNRKVWVAEIPEDDEHRVGPVSVLIEQFGDRPPTVAFRRRREQSWGRPYRGEVR